MSEIVTVIDFSADGIRLVTGYPHAGQTHVLSALEGEEIPLDEHGYLDQKKATESLALLLSTARKTVSDLGVFIILIPPHGLEIHSGEGTTKTSDPMSHISPIDYVNASNIIIKNFKSPNKSHIYFAPFVFLDDNRAMYQEFPMGKDSEQLTISGDAMLVDSLALSHYQKIMADLQLDLYLSLPSPYGAIYLLNLFNPPASYIALDLQRDEFTLSFVSKKRLQTAQCVPFGIKDGLRKASESLGVSFDDIDEHFALFGFTKDSGFPYLTKFGKSLEECQKALTDAFSPLYEEVKSFHDRYMTDDEPLYILSYGLERNIPLFSEAFEEKTGEKINMFQSNFTGARSPVYVNSLGAIRIANLPFQKSIPQAKLRTGDQLLKNQSFSKK